MNATMNEVKKSVKQKFFAYVPTGERYWVRTEVNRKKQFAGNPHVVSIVHTWETFKHTSPNGQKDKITFEVTGEHAEHYLSDNVPTARIVSNDGTTIVAVWTF